MATLLSRWHSKKTLKAAKSHALRLDVFNTTIKRFTEFVVSNSYGIFSIHYKVQEIRQENKRLQGDLNEVNTSALQQVR